MGAQPFPTKLSEVKDRYGLSALLRVSDRGLRHLLYGIPSAQWYWTFTIPKKSGGTREIKCPVPRLKNIQRRLLRLIEAEYTPKSVVHGFVKSKGIKSNALNHIGRRYVLNIDLQDFFPSIHFGRVRGLFMADPFNLPRDVAGVIATICCFEKTLPQGAPTSPIVSNLICRRLDSHLRRFASSANCRYTRYADDITISAGRNGNIEKFATKSASGIVLSKKLLGIIQDNDFQVNAAKLRLQGTNTRQVVTGLVTNAKANIPRKFLRNVRAMLHNAEVHKLRACQQEFELRRTSAGYRDKSGKQFLSLLKGRIEFIRHIRGLEDQTYLRLALRLAQISPQSISPTEVKRARLVTNPSGTILDSLWVVDVVGPNDGDFFTSTAVALPGGGLLTCNHCVPDGFRVSVYKRDESLHSAAEVSFRDEKLDLAVLEISKRFEGHFTLAGENPGTETPIRLAGFPHYSSTNLGVVEHGRITGMKTNVDGNPRYVVSTPIILGNSGGPILNDNFEIVGIAAKGNKKLTREEDNNQPEAIPVDCVRKFIEKAVASYSK